MLEGGSNGTDWSAYEVIDMWLAIGNQETTPHWQVVTGWRRSYELTSEHLAAVKSYRDNLAEAWPPEKNAASKAYRERLDKLVDHLQQTYDSAFANHEALRDAASALSLSRAKLEPIVNEYLANESLLQQFAETPPTSQPGHGKTKAPAPKPPVADGRQEELASQARSIMYSLGNDLTVAQSKLVQPAEYSPAIRRDDQGHDVDGSSNNTPTVPPVVPFDPHSSSSGVSAGSGSAPPTTHPANAGLGSSTAPPTGPRQPGLVLGGTQPPGAPPVPITGISPTPISSGGGTWPMPGTISPTLPITGDTAGGVSNRPIGSLGAPRGLIGEPLGRVAPLGAGVRAMPPGGIIGGTPGMGLGQPGSGARPVQRVNPAGGVLEPGGAPTRGGTRSPGGSVGQQLGAPNGRNGRRDSEDSESWDPDNPWATAEGVAPIVLPADEQRIDPGPAIGLG